MRLPVLKCRPGSPQYSRHPCREPQTDATSTTTCVPGHFLRKSPCLAAPPSQECLASYNLVLCPVTRTQDEGPRTSHALD